MSLIFQDARKQVFALSSCRDLSLARLVGLKPPETPLSLRLDKWLWHARFVKSRSLAVTLITTSGVRIDGIRVTKAGHAVRIGSVLTFALGQRVVVLRILGLGLRRGPAAEARALYEDLSPEAPPSDMSRPNPVAGGRPDKRDRRRFSVASPDALD